MCPEPICFLPFVEMALISAPLRRVTAPGLAASRARVVEDHVVGDAEQPARKGKVTILVPRHSGEGARKGLRREVFSFLPCPAVFPAESVDAREIEIVQLTEGSRIVTRTGDKLCRSLAIYRRLAPRPHHRLPTARFARARPYPFPALACLAFTVDTYDDSMIGRFWEQVDRSEDPDACWNWTGPLHASGYGIFNLGTRQELAHRLVFEFSGRQVPYGFVVMRTCGNRLCCNPSHLQIVTPAEHMAARSRLRRLLRPTKQEKPDDG